MENSFCIKHAPYCKLQTDQEAMRKFVSTWLELLTLDDFVLSNEGGRFLLTASSSGTPPDWKFLETMSVGFSVPTLTDEFLSTTYIRLRVSVTMWVHSGGMHENVHAHWDGWMRIKRISTHRRRRPADLWRPLMLVLHWWPYRPEDLTRCSLNQSSPKSRKWVYNPIDFPENKNLISGGAPLPNLLTKLL